MNLEAAFAISSIPVARNPWRELPEDAILEGGDIPGLVAEPQSSFDFVEREVRQYLQECAPTRVEAVLQRLRAFESTVFETRTMPRLSPRRQLDLDITEVAGARPAARRPYPVDKMFFSPVTGGIQYSHIPSLAAGIATLFSYQCTISALRPSYWSSGKFFCFCTGQLTFLRFLF